VYIDIKEVLDLKRRLEEINRLPIKSIKWYYNGNRVLVKKHLRNSWKKSNLDFIDVFISNSPRLRELMKKLNEETEKEVMKHFLEENDGKT
tara:strand:+ start:1853 stop:2125 length:273 start_codon:yes stop_codon:yes gene_type:complete